jgi:hypothetical protein
VASDDNEDWIPLLDPIIDLGAPNLRSGIPAKVRGVNEFKLRLDWTQACDHLFSHQTLIRTIARKVTCGKSLIGKAKKWAQQDSNLRPPGS